MNQIYERPTYILAVLDLHREYLMKNNMKNREVMHLIWKHRRTIYKNISGHDSSLISKNKINVEEEMDEEYYKELKKSYQFLAHLIEDWSNRTWVISEIQIAKEKYIKHGTPLKYIFMSLEVDYKMPFFSYFFDDNQYSNTNSNKSKLSYKDVDDDKKFIQFLNERLAQRPHLDMILGSYAARYEDRLNAILPSWNKYNHIIKDIYTISDWNITTMTSLILKLYEILDLWDKARLLYACSQSKGNSVIIPSFASSYDGSKLHLYEKDDHKKAYELYIFTLLFYVLKMDGNREDINGYINNRIMDPESLIKENLMGIQLQREFLSVRSAIYFVINVENEFDQQFFYNTPLENERDLKLIFIPYFSFSLPDYIRIPPKSGSSIYLIGEFDINRWVLTHIDFNSYPLEEFSFCDEGYEFNIY